MSSAEKGMELFLRQQLFRERSVALEKFSLRHAGAGARGTAIDEFPIQGQVDTGILPLLVGDIMARAQNYADGLGNKLQRFTLEALTEGAKTGPKFSFRLRGEAEDDEDGDGEEAPTERGLTSQLMRHNEALMRMLVMTTGSSVTHLQRQLEKSGETIETLVQQQNEQRRLIETANSEQHERDLQMLLTSGQEERKASLFKQVESLIPVVIRKATGQPLLTGQEAGIVGPFLKSLTPDQIRAMAQNLTPEQQIALFQVYKELTKDDAPQKQGQNGVS